MSGNKSERSMSPAAMSEESRRELIARQHRALYGNESPAFFPPGAFNDDHSNRTDNTNSGSSSSAQVGMRGPSPRGADPFGLGQSQTQNAPDANIAGRQSPSRANSASSPSGANPGYSVYDTNVEQPATSTSSPGGATDSPSSRQLPSKTSTVPMNTVGPIGSRPSQSVSTSQASNPALNKRSTTPLPSPLGYGFAPNESANTGTSGNERSTSSASNPSTSAPGTKESNSSSVNLGWGNSSGVWGSKNSLGVQASVWG